MLTAHDVQRLTTAVLDILGREPDRTRAEVAAALHESIPGLAQPINGRMVMLLMAHLEMHRELHFSIVGNGSCVRWSLGVGSGENLHSERVAVFTRDRIQCGFMVTQNYVVLIFAMTGGCRPVLVQSNT